MSLRLTQFSKSDLDALANAAGLADFPSAPDGYSPAVTWDPAEAHYAVDTIVVDGAGHYWRVISTPPAGTPCTHPTYYTDATPDWIGYMNLVRYTARGLIAVHAMGLGPTAGVPFWESAVLSGPWELPWTYEDTPDGASGLYLTQRWQGGVGGVPYDSTGHSYEACPYGLLGLELYSQSSTARLDFKAQIGANNSMAVATTATTHVWRLTANFAGLAYVSGSITVGLVQIGAPGHTIIGGDYTDDGSNITWTFSGTTLVSGIDIGVTLSNGDGFANIGLGIEVGLDNLIITWPGQAAALANNVISTVDVYRALAPSPLPRVALVCYELVSGVITPWDYAEGVNSREIWAAPVNHSPGDAPWRVRGYTLPASDVHYGASPPLDTDAIFQRQWYVCQPVADTRVVTPSANQCAIRELDTVFGKRLISTVDQLKPVLDRSATSVDRGVVSATVGYLRSGDLSMTRVFTSAALSVSGYQMEHVNYLGRSGALIVWDNSTSHPLPLRWSGSGIWVMATGPMGAWVPNHAQGWSWGGGALSTTALGYFYCAACHVDDLLAALALL